MGTWKKLAGLFVVVDPKDSQVAEATGSGPADASEIDRILAESKAMLEPESPAPKPAAPPLQAPSRPTRIPAQSVPSSPRPSVPVAFVPSEAGAAAAATNAATPSDAPSAIREGRPFSEIYTENALPPCAQPAEKILKVLEGLAALPTATRVAAISAMDAADDAWTIDDPVVDAQRKIQALTGEQVRLTSSLQAAEEQSRAELQSQEQTFAEITTLIQEEIARLQAQLQQENQNALDKKASIEAGIQATRESFRRETERVDREIGRLGQIAAMFGTGSSPQG